MKFIRINDILVLKEKGDSVTGNGWLDVTFINPGEGNYITISSKSSTPNNKFYSAIHPATTKISIPRNSIKEDGDYEIALYEKSADDIEIVAKGYFGVAAGVITSAFQCFPLEIQRVWSAIVYLAEQLGVDEVALDKLITGYVTE